MKTNKEIIIEELKRIRDKYRNWYYIPESNIEKIASNLLSKLKKDEIVIARGELDNIKWESPYNKLVFYFKGLPKMIGIKIIKDKKVKIILESEE